MNKVQYTDYIIHLHGNQYKKPLQYWEFGMWVFLAYCVLAMGFMGVASMGLRPEAGEIRKHEVYGTVSRPDLSLTKRASPSTDQDWTPPDYSDAGKVTPSPTPL
jgi:hypothetical protein